MARRRRRRSSRRGGSQRARFRAAAKHCKGRSHSAFIACMRSELGGRKRRRRRR